MQIGNINNSPVPPWQTSVSLPSNNATPTEVEENSPTDVINVASRNNPMNSPSALRNLGNALRGAQDPGTVNRLWNETAQAAETLRTLITTMLGRNQVTGQPGQAAWAQNAVSLDITESERAEAQALVAEDGFFGVSRTTERIMGFAQALVGENASPQQIERMRDAVQRGFDDVARVFGGFENLPDVTQRTHSAIMESFDNWLAGGAPAVTATA